MEPWATHLITFLVGTFTGAAGGYYASKFTDQRRLQETRSEASSTFKSVQQMMPALIAEMKADFAGEGAGTVREFFVLSSKGVRLGGSSQPRFRYFEDEHPGLRGFVTVLENHGYVVDVTPGSTPIFRMTEEFVRLVKASK